MQLQVARVGHHHLHLRSEVVHWTKQKSNLRPSPDVHANVNGGVERVRLHDGDVAVLGDVVRHVDRVALRVRLVDVHHLQEEGSSSQEEATMPTSPSGWSAARSTSSKLGGRATPHVTKRKAKANLIMILAAIMERAVSR